MEFGTRERLGLTVAVTAVTLGSLGAWLMQRPRAAAGDLPTPTAMTSALEAPPTPKALEFPAGEEPSAPATPPEMLPAPPSPTPTPVAQLVVHVSGAVKKPGVYTFKVGDRIYHAIRAAGGLKPNADPDAHNQAEYLRDADNIHFPVKRTAIAATVPPPAPARPLITRGTSPTATTTTPTTPEPPRGRVLGKEPPPVAVVIATGTEESTGTNGESTEGSSSKKSGKLRTPGEGTVNINTAGAEELQRLPGVGPAMASRILDYRQQIGRFNAPEQLKDVKGIGEKTYAKMSPFVTVQ